MKDDFVSDEAKEVQDLTWDKFMDDIVKRELDSVAAQREHMERHRDHPTRKLNRLGRETPHNRTRFIGKK